MAATKAQKIRLGIFAVAAALALAVVLIVFAGLHFWQRQDHYTIYFEDSVIGLEEGAAVSFGGIKVGNVESIAVAPDDLRKVRVRIAVKAGLPIRTDTTATLQFAGITGLKLIDLHGGDVRAPRLASGGVIATGETVLDKFEHQAETLVAQSKEIMTNANRVMANLATVTDPKQFQAVGEIVESAHATSANLAATSAELRTLVAENRVAIRHTVASIDEVAIKANALLDGEVPELLGEAGGVVGELRGVVRDNSTSIRTSLFDLRQAARSFKELARDLRQRPSRLLFSDTANERKLPK